MALRMAVGPNGMLGLLAVAAFGVVLGVANRDRMADLGLALAGDGGAPAGVGRALAGSAERADAQATGGTRARGKTQALAQVARRPGTDGQSGTQADAAAAQGQASSSASPSAAAKHPSLRREPTAEESQTIARLSEEVRPQGETTSEDAEKRGDAIRKLATLPGPQAAQALVHATRNDDDPRNRILAVEALRRAGAAGDANWVIRDALRDASASSDEIIAAQARAAYDELVAKLGTQR